MRDDIGMRRGRGGDDHRRDGRVAEQPGDRIRATNPDLGLQALCGRCIGVRNPDQLRPGHHPRDIARVHRAYPASAEHRQTDRLLRYVNASSLRAAS